MHILLRLPRFREPRAARATTSQPFRQLPNAAPATQTQMHRMLRLHDFGNGISKVLRLPRFRTPRAARATTSQPFRQLPNAAPATQTHTQMHRMLRLPQLRQWHLQSAAPATISRPEPRAQQHPSPLDSCQMLPLPRKHTLRCTEYCACLDFASPEPRARQHPSPLDSCQMLPLPRKHTLRCTECCACHDFGNGISKVLRLPRFREPRAARATTSQPFRQLPNAAPATQTHTHTHSHAQNAAPATTSAMAFPKCCACHAFASPEPRARDNIPAL